MALWGRKRQQQDSSGDQQSSSSSSSSSRRRNTGLESGEVIPYIEADPTLGEIPLDQLDSFIVPARDEKGGTIVVHVSLTPFMERQLKIAVASRRFPYLSVGDFVRHACVRHLYWLMDIRHTIPRHVHSDMEAVNNHLLDQELASQVESAYHRMDAIIASHLQSGFNMEALKLYLRVRALVSDSAPSTWKTRFITGLDNRYRYLMAEATNNVQK